MQFNRIKLTYSLVGGLWFGSNGPIVMLGGGAIA